jgi:HPt (histidine-containing phosphotransfer) domain-containing protein
MGTAPVLDVARGLASCAENPDIHREVVGILAGDIEARVAAVQQALGNNDLAVCAGLAHKNKGACLTVGAIALAELFTSIDHACRRGDSATAASTALLLPDAATAFRSAVANLK